MKIAIPTDGTKGLNENVAEHFGRCLSYTVLDENGNLIEIIENTSSHMGGEGLPPDLLKKNNIDVLLCRGIGPKAIELCNQFSIKTYVDNSKTVKEIFNNWKKNELSKATLDDSCKEHRR